MGALRRLAVLTLAAAALSACGTSPAGGSPRGAVPSTGAVPSAGAQPYDCIGRLIDPIAFAEERLAQTLPAEQLAIVTGATDDAGAPIGLDPSEWIVVAATEDRIGLMRRVDEGDPGWERDHDWEFVELGILGSAGWMRTSGATCALSYDLSPLTAAQIALDPAAPPAASSPQVGLLVTERECNGGRDAQGRVRLVELVETDNEVSVMIGVDRSGLDGAYECPSNPPTPFTVTLQVPLGDRTILNGNLVDPRPIEPWDPANG